MNRSGQYDVMEKEYVTGGDEVSITSLAARYGRGKSAVARMARLRGWYDKRAAYRETESERTYDATIDAYLPRIVKLNEKFIEAAEKTVDRYVEAIENREITPNTSDVAKIMGVIQTMTGKTAAGESPEASGDIRIPEGVGVEAIRALEQLARSRLGPGDSPKAARPQLVSSGGG